MPRLDTKSGTYGNTRTLDYRNRSSGSWLHMLAFGTAFPIDRRKFASNFYGQSVVKFLPCIGSIP
jgi:hypothetical protein